MSTMEQSKYPPIEETAIKFHGDSNSCNEAKYLFNAFTKALAMDTKLPKSIVHMKGMSGKKFRYLINNFVSDFPEPAYLEIGSWMGSTLCSAIFKNKVRAIAIDNWSEFNGPKEPFDFNVKRVLEVSPEVDFRLIENDFNKVNYADIGKFNIYFFDGPHQELDQYMGVKIVQPALTDAFTLIVDDWNWSQVVHGTRRAMEECQIKVLFAIEITTARKESYPLIDKQYSEWHNGYYLAICKKS
jgi:hypothetical protein